MKRSFYIRAAIAPALGDVRCVKAGDTIYLSPDAPQRADWTRYVDAIACAIAQGANVQWVREGQ